MPLEIFIRLSQIMLALSIGLMAANAAKAFHQFLVRKVIQTKEKSNHWPAWAQQLRLGLLSVSPVAERLIVASPAIRRELSAVGHDPRFDDREFSRLQISGSILIAVAMLFVGLAMMQWFDVSTQKLFFISAASAGFFFLVIRIKLRDRFTVSRNRIIASLPNLLDVLSVTLETGRNFQASIQLAVSQMPESKRNQDLRFHLKELMRDLRSGESRATALQKMSDRLVIPEITQFTASIITAERQGASIAGILRRQAEQLRTSRALAAERIAMRAPVKLLAPLAICIFPCTFAILIFPVSVRLLESGLF
jgi:tight adherence protein C